MEAVFHAADNDELAESTANKNVWCTACAVTKGVVYAATKSLAESMWCALQAEPGARRDGRRRD